MSDIIKRDLYLKKLINRMNNGLIKIITGVRRCGKSFLLFELFYKYLLSQGVRNDHIIQVVLDDEEYALYRDPLKLSEYIRSRVSDDDMYYIFIDEVQLAISKEEIKNKDIKLYGVLNGLLRRSNVDIYITGSNSKMLTSDVLTVFRGRGDEIRVYPLSFKEFYDYRGNDKIEAYEEYALYGGMPLVLKRKNDEDKEEYLKLLFTETYFKDILERYSIEYPDVLSELTDDLCSSIGSLTNVSKITDTLRSVKKMNINNVTINNYLTYLMESFLFSNAKRYDIKGKKHFAYPSKYYCVDIGLRNARLNFRQQEETHIMENIIYNDLLVRGYSVDVGVVEIVEIENGKRKKKNYEIDFVVNKGSKRYYIQSALNVDRKEKYDVEMRPFRYTNDFFKKIIITKSNVRPWTDDSGILHINLYDFLLMEEPLDI